MASNSKHYIGEDAEVGAVKSKTQTKDERENRRKDKENKRKRKRQIKKEKAPYLVSKLTKLVMERR